MIVDDNQSDVELAKRALIKARVTNNLVVAEDGQEALDYLFGTGAFDGRNVADFPSLTLLDLSLPKVSGIEVLRRIRSDPRTKRLLIVVLTSSDEERDLAAVYDLGVNSYIRKPVDFKQFAHCIEQVGLYWLVLNEPVPRE